MKTIFKIMRSIIASLLFLFLIFSCIIQYSFTASHKEQTRIPDRISRREILDQTIDVATLNPEEKELFENYINDYIGYIFYKRSYPSIQTIDLNSLPEYQIEAVKKQLYEINKKIEIEYETVVKIRSINNLLSNGSIYLMINIALFVVFLLLIIVTANPTKSILLFGIALVISALISQISTLIIVSNFHKWVSQPLYTLLNPLFSKGFLSGLHAQTIVYLIIGLSLFLSAYTYSKKHIFYKHNSAK